MKIRGFWQKEIKKMLSERPIVWLMGVRRAGKTFLCKSFSDALYFDCELPSVRRMLDDPEIFLDGLRNRFIVLDEIHRLPNPSEILKIAADHYDDIKIITTGSSTLAASKKFRDTLTGRKHELWLTPMTLSDMIDFGDDDLKHRFLHGGLPPFFMAKRYPERDFQEWMDSFWAKDIQELFRLEKRYSFQKFFELLMAQSGGIFEANSFAVPCEASRTTIANYLKALEATFVAYIVRPFNSHRQSEIISAPKVYGFDTGFVCYYRGWEKLREEDCGYLWEHFVLNEIYAHKQTRDVMYWRDKQGHEVDFILRKRSDGSPIVLECKWKEEKFDFKSIRVFLNHYPKTQVYVIANNTRARHARRYGDGIIVNFISLSNIRDILELVIR